MFNVESHLMHKRNFYGVTEIISENQTRKWISMSVLILGWEIIFSIAFFFVKYDKTCIFRTMCLIFGFYMQMDILFQFKSECVMTKRIYNAYSSSLKSHMMNRLSGLKTEEKMSLISRVTKFKHAHMEIIRIVDEVNEFMNPSFIFWSLCTCLTLVINIYVAVMTDFQGSFKEIFSKQLFAYLSAIGVCNVCFDTEEMNHLSDDTLSFLFKYPISKLSETEAYQVEMLIYTLSSQKPTIKASDIFTVGTKLLASISGTVVTYVLVALQFRPAWRD
ncbi:uncharacterized protein LOC123316007 [Coccinella septempunctata]|uniref:uncharacterized protein LOC123316007 n=1 Tax=Coccinella septempunctata TaxID=41139 RepID=UPI001D070992|nr:uncharacterized protein LOC123316007 [Coccinella septempunctata]